MIFQFTFKKIISLLACISITISCLVIPASAVSPGTVIEGIGAVGTLWDISMEAYELWQEQNPDADPSEYPGFNPGGSFSGAGGSRDDAIARYEEYVNSLQTDLGTATLIDGGIRVYFEPQFVGVSSFDVDKFISPNISGVNFSSRFQFSSSTSYHPNYNTVYISYKPFVLPFQASSYYLGYDVVNCTVSGASVYGYLSKGSEIFPRTGSNSGNSVSDSGVLCGEFKSTFYDWCLTVKPYRLSDNGVGPASFDFSVACYVDIYPNTEFVDPSTYQLSLNSRPSSIIGDYGIMGDDGTIVKVEGNTIINETDKSVYNPITTIQTKYTDCAFNYEDRSYTLTLEDGSTMKVVYGDENVTIHEGDTVYNVYYLSSDSGSGDGSGNGSGDGSGVGDAVSGLLGGLGNILAGLIEGLLKMAAQAVEALGGLIDIFNGLVDMILGFFSGFTGFLGSMFPFLPEETFVILNFGLILLIAAAVIKKLFL